MSNNSPAKDVAKYLGGQIGLAAFASVSDWGVFVALEPDQPKKCVTVYDTGGAGPLTDELDFESVEFQVRVRAENYSDAYDKQEAIKDLLLQTAPLACEDHTFAGIAMVSSIISLGRDESNCFVLTANYRGFLNV